MIENIRIDLLKTVKCPVCHNDKLITNKIMNDGKFITTYLTCSICGMPFDHEREADGQI
mgnify:CR=1 FL=1